MDQAPQEPEGSVQTAPEDREAPLRTRAVLLVTLVASTVVAGQVGAVLAGVAPGYALMSGVVAGVLLGALLAGPLVVGPAQSSDAKRRAMIARIERVARTDREDLFDDLLECEKDGALGPLAHAVHDALVRAHRDRLEAAALRREMSSKVEREAKRRTVTLENEAERDELTGLLNRRGFDRRLALLMDDTRIAGDELVLLAIDMDRFKQLNDTCGHEKGDEALRIAGDLLRAHTRNDDLAARVGGDELFLALRSVDGATAKGIGERLIDLFTKHPAGTGLACEWPGMSIGISRLQEDRVPDVDTFKRLADEALYESKRSGRGRVTIARAA